MNLVRNMNENSYFLLAFKNIINKLKKNNNCAMIIT